MKKLVLVIALIAICFSGIFAESFARDGMLIAPGEMNVTVGASFPLGVTASLDYPIGTFNISFLKFTYGATGMANIMFGGDPIYFTAGGLGTLHFSWACFDFTKDMDWIQNFDTFIGLGIGYSTWGGFDAGNGGGIRFISQSGFSYFFKETMAVSFGYSYPGSFIGLLLKF